MIDKEVLRHKGNVLIPAIAYGDAAGLPVETRSAEYIAEHYGVINELIGSSENPFYVGSYGPGMWSDDTQLSIAVARGLINADGFDIFAQAKQHIRAYDETAEIERRGVMVKRGWGGSTTAAMEQLKQGVTPEHTGTKDGAGNGVLMKMAPLVYWQVARGDSATERYEQYDQLTTMTHDSDVARFTTRVHGDVLHALASEGYDKETFLEALRESVTRHAAATGQDEAEYQAFFQFLEGELSKEIILANTDKKGFYAPETLRMAYGAFLAHDADGVPSLYEAVNLGGDTDSTASINAAMAVFATRDTVRLPIDHQNLDQLPLLKRTSLQLANRALGRLYVD